jgi:nucleotide-binding universal stress UspA family protein
MFEKILFPTDFSGPAKTELTCITSIPGIREIILLHVIRQYGIPMGAEMIEGLEAQVSHTYLHEAKSYIATLNPEIQVTPKEKTSTDITGAILETAEEYHAGLIIIHANIKGIMAGVLLSCVSSKVLCRISKTNIMIMPNKLVESLTGKTYQKYCPMIFTRVLCPTDFSDLSLKAIDLTGIIKERGEIILLHVVETGEPNNPDEAFRTAEIKIQTIRDNLVAQGIKARTIVVTGNPETEIPRVAQEEDVSLIWMRSAAKGCLHDFFFGSMVHAVVMNAKQPVIIIRDIE